MINQLFTLLRLGLRISEPSEKDLSVFVALTLNEWERLFKITDNQGVAAIALDGLGELIDKFGQSKICPDIDKGKWQLFLLEWIGTLQVIEQNNGVQTRIMEEMAGFWNAAGCQIMVFKGQANGQMYPTPSHRNPGDIDCYLFGNYSKGNDIARKAGAVVDEGWYKHSQIAYKGEMFENHQFFVHTRGGAKSKLLEKELEDHLRVDQWKSFPDCELIKMPPAQWNATFLTYHACAHFLSEGLRLKQLLDWAMFLYVKQNEVNWEEFYGFCDRYHFRRFVDAVTAISVAYLGVKIINPQIVIKKEYSDKVLHSIFDKDQDIKRTGGWKERIQIIKHLFKNKWKYDDIYQQSVWKQLWMYAKGYVTRAE